MRQNLGVGALRVHYGGRNKRKGAVPEHFAKASGGLIRHIFKQLGESRLVLSFMSIVVGALQWWFQNTGICL